MSNPSPSRIEQTPIRLSTKVAEERQTPKTDFGSRMKDGLSVAASTLATGAAVVAPLVPGGAILSAAVTGANQMGSSLSSGQRAGTEGLMRGAYGTTTGTSTIPALGGTSTIPALGGTGIPTLGGTGIPNIPSDPYTMGMDMLAQTQAANMQYLMLQNQMQQENQKYSTLSNVLKTRHDTAKNSIQNIH